MTAVVALLSAVVGAGAVLIAQSQAIDAQMEQQRQHFAHEQESAARAQRLPIYEEFHDAANAYGVRSQLAYECQVSTERFCEGIDDELQGARHRYQGAVNRMHIYGSPAAIAAMVLVSQSLPPSIVGLAGEPVVEPVNDDEFADALTLFYDVMCVDLAEDPEYCNEPSSELLKQLELLNTQ